MQFFGFGQNAVYAPAGILAFIEPLVSALIIQQISDMPVRFIFSVLVTSQLVFLTEVGIMVMKSNVSIKLGKLVIIYTERMIISVPVIVLLSKWIF